MAKKWYYVTVEERHLWNISVEAESEDEAKELAEVESTMTVPDYKFYEPTEAEEVKKYVE